MNDVLTVKFFTVNRHIPDIECAGVRLPVADSVKGEFSGSYGIRKGHARAVFSLKEGTVILSSNEKTVFKADISEGFATIENNIVCIMVNSISDYSSEQ